MMVRSIDVDEGDAFIVWGWQERVVETEDGTKAYWRSTSTGHRGSVLIATVQREWLRLGTRATRRAHVALAKLDKRRRDPRVRR